MPVLNANIIVFTHGITQYRNHTICELWFAPGVSWTVQKRQTLERQRKIRKRKGVLPPNPPPSSEPRRPRGKRTLSLQDGPAGRIPPAGRQRRRPAPGAGAGSGQLRTAAPRPSRARSSAFRPRVSASPAPAAHHGADQLLPSVRRPQRRSSSRPWIGASGWPRAARPGKGWPQWRPRAFSQPRPDPSPGWKGQQSRAEPGGRMAQEPGLLAPGACSIVPGDFLLKCTF